VPSRAFWSNGPGLPGLPSIRHPRTDTDAAQDCSSGVGGGVRRRSLGSALSCQPSIERSGTGSLNVAVEPWPKRSLIRDLRQLCHSVASTPRVRPARSTRRTLSNHVRCTHRQGREPNRRHVVVASTPRPQEAPCLLEASPPLDSERQGGSMTKDCVRDSADESYQAEDEACDSHACPALRRSMPDARPLCRWLRGSCNTVLSYWF